MSQIRSITQGRTRMILLVLIILTVSCKKFLDKKPVTTLEVPSSFTDLQALLDDVLFMNQGSPDLLQIVCDDYYAVTNDYQSSPVLERLNYIWDKTATYSYSYIQSYQRQVYNSNIVLDALPGISASSGSISMYNNIKGSALFYRCFSFFNLAQLYCKPYSTTAGTDWGIVLRLSSAIENEPGRSTVQQTYDQIIDDLKTAIGLLPANALYPTRPSKAAAFGLLARTYLSMGDYVNAGNFADSCLGLQHTLMDFNMLTPGYIPHFNPETIFYDITQTVTGIIYPPFARVDSSLYASYAPNDLRQSVFYAPNGDGTYYFQGSYDADYWQSCIFDGITTDEMYLIRAECYARNNSTANAMADLNALLTTRWVTNTFTPFTASTAAQALTTILAERRKELAFRGLRWSDIRRLNVAGANITLSREEGGASYSLPPNDLRSVMLIPLEVTSVSHIPQNPR